MPDINENKQTKEQGFNRNISFSKRLRREGRSSEAFEVMLSALTLEEILALKFECTGRLTHGKVYGLHLWNNMVEITKEAEEKLRSMLF